MRSFLNDLDNLFEPHHTTPSFCISSSILQTFLVEDNAAAQKCVIENLSEKTPLEIEIKYLRINNPNLTNIYLWAIDGCFFMENDGTRCDCIIFSESDFVFVEFKLNATSRSPDTIKENRNKACIQLEKTIIFIFQYKDQIPLFHSFLFKAVLCSPPHYPRKNTSLSSKKIHFWDRYKVVLEESSNLTFRVI